MKICRKCKIEYKNDYVYCPKCGTPYDKNMKKVKTPGDIGGILGVMNKIWNGFLYGLGGLLIIAYIVPFKENMLSGEEQLMSSIFAILFGLSLFKVFYTIIEDKFIQIDIKYIKIARIAIPIILLITWMMCTPVESIEDEKDKQPQNNIEQKEETNNDISNTENKEDNNEDNTKDEVKETTYILKYNELGDFGKFVEYENENQIFYYLPDGQYKVEAINLNNNICFLWVDYRKGYQNGSHGTAYNTKEKLTFTTSKKINSVNLDSSVHIYNSNDCDYKFTLIK